jgi:predicted secreted protein
MYFGKRILKAINPRLIRAHGSIGRQGPRTHFIRSGLTFGDRLFRNPTVFLRLVLLFFFLAGLNGCLEPSETDLTIHPDGSWTVRAQLSLDRPFLALQEGQPALDHLIHQKMRTFLNSPTIRSTTFKENLPDGGIRYAFLIEGPDLTSLMEAVTRKETLTQWLFNAGSLEFKGPLAQAEVLEIILPANPSTGYSWELPPEKQGTIFRIESRTSEPLSPGLGTPARQVIRLRVQVPGEEGLRLVYKRPWESPDASKHRVSVASHGPGLAEISKSLGPFLSAASKALIKTGRPAQSFTDPPALAFEEVVALPASFNWCDQNGCTPIKNQGGCGSCWAFATVGPLESNLRIQQGLTTNLSEQYLVSCNTEGWDCSGGWWAHDYHQWKYAYKESQAGAIQESSFPYVAANAACGGPYVHPHKITSWAYVGNDYSVPSVEAIKKAIHNYGPVAAAIYVGSDFQSYRGGIFSSTQTGVVNHGIVLTGWDDGLGVWILRNSWGTGWGESGTMKIRYGISQVGYAASYVTLAPLTSNYRLYIPFLTIPVLPPECLIPNGDFESGSEAWSSYSSSGRPLILNPTPPLAPHSGSWAVYLLGDNNETAFIEKPSLNIPASCPRLTFWHSITSEESCGRDFEKVLINDQVIATFDLCKATETSGWAKRSVDLGFYAGQTVSLQIRAEADSSSPSLLVVDDVAFEFALDPWLEGTAPERSK